MSFLWILTVHRQTLIDILVEDCPFLSSKSSNLRFGLWLLEQSNFEDRIVVVLKTQSLDDMPLCLQSIVSIILPFKLPLQNVLFKCPSLICRYCRIWAKRLSVSSLSVSIFTFSTKFSPKILAIRKAINNRKYSTRMSWKETYSYQNPNKLKAFDLNRVRFNDLQAKVFGFFILC